MSVLLVSRLTTQNAGNEALSKLLIRFGATLFPGEVVSALDRYPRSFERYTLAGLGDEPERRLDQIAALHIERGDAETPLPTRSASTDLVRLDPRGRELGGMLRSIKRSIGLRRRLATIGLIEREDTRRAIQACMSNDLVVWNPAGEIEPNARSVDHITRLLLLLRIAQLSKRATAVLNHSLEPANEQISRLIAHVYRNATLVGVRDETSAGVAREMGVNPERIVVAPDLVFLTSRLDAPVRHEGPREAVAVAINGLVAGKQFEEWRGVADGLRALGRPLIFVSNAMNHDRAFLTRLRDLVGHGTVYEGQPGYLELRRIYSQCAAVLSSRLHASILALAEGVPVVSIEPSDFKLTAIFEQMHYPIATTATHAPTWTRQVLDNLDRCLADNAELRVTSRAKVAEQARRIETTLARLQTVTPWPQQPEGVGRWANARQSLGSQ